MDPFGTQRKRTTSDLVCARGGCSVLGNEIVAVMPSPETVTGTLDPSLPSPHPRVPDLAPEVPCLTQDEGLDP